MPIVEDAEGTNTIPLDTLVIRAKEGDRDAWDELIRQFSPMVRAIAKKKGMDESHIDDIEQETFIRAMKKIHQLNNPMAFSSWLWSITSRMIIAVMKRDRTREFLDVRNIIHTAHKENDPIPIHVAMQNECNRRLWNIVGQLSRFDKEVIVAFYRDGQGIQAMAQSFSVPVGTIKRRLFTARQRLRDKIPENFWS